MCTQHNLPFWRLEWKCHRFQQRHQNPVASSVHKLVNAILKLLHHHLSHDHTVLFTPPLLTACCWRQLQAKLMLKCGDCDSSCRVVFSLKLKKTYCSWQGSRAWANLKLAPYVHTGAIASFRCDPHLIAPVWMAQNLKSALLLLHWMQNLKSALPHHLHPCQEDLSILANVQISQCHEFDIWLQTGPAVD